MSNSKLVDYTRISPNSSNPRNHKIDTITIHHTAGVASVEQLGSIFANKGRQASSNYGIGSDGRVGQYVDEANRSWCSSSRENDNRAITIEVSNSAYGGNWPVSQPVLEKLIDLCVDICQRNKIKKLKFTGDKTGNLTMHKWFAATACPGPYLESKFPYIADEVNKRLGAQTKPNNKKYVPTVLEWQNAAIADGYKFPKYGVDGLWGAECVGVATNALCQYCSPNWKNKNLTKLIQKFLCIEVDGKFGNDTTAAVIAYQHANELDADGIVGINTWKKILNIA